MLDVLGSVGSLRLQKQGYDHVSYYQRSLIPSMTETSRQLFDGITMEASLIPLHSLKKSLANIPSRTLGYAQQVLLSLHFCKILSQV